MQEDYNSWHTGVEIDTAVDEVPNKIDSINGNIVDKDIILNTLNYVDTSAPLSNQGNCYFYNGVVALYYLRNIDTYFRLNIAKTLKANVNYILSFNADGVIDDQSPSFRCTRSGVGYLTDKFVIKNGRNVIKLLTSSDITDFILFDDTDTISTRPQNQNIRLYDFQIQEGNTGTEYQPSLQSINNNVIENATRAYIAEYQGWRVGVVKDEFVTAVTNLSGVNLSVDSTIDIPNSTITIPRYRTLPFPMDNECGISGLCSAIGCFITGVSGRVSNGAITGVSYRIQDTQSNDSITTNVRLMASGIRKSPPQSPSDSHPYNDEKARQIISIAQSYVDAQEGGRKFKYGANIFYSNSDIVNYRGNLWEKNTNYKVSNVVYYVDIDNNITSYSCKIAHDSPDTDSPDSSYWTTNWTIIEHSAAMVECDTYVGLVLRGIPYESSPFATSDSPSYRYTYSQLMANTTHVNYDWCINIRNHIQNPIYQTGADIRYAAEDAWMFWGLDGQIFYDFSQAKKGDICFWRSPKTKVTFDNVSHCGILDIDDNGVAYIYEVSGEGQTGGKVLHKTPLAKMLHKPDYFARVY